MGRASAQPWGQAPAPLRAAPGHLPSEPVSQSRRPRRGRTGLARRSPARRSSCTGTWHAAGPGGQGEASGQRRRQACARHVAAAAAAVAAGSRHTARCSMGHPARSATHTQNQPSECCTSLGTSTASELVKVGTWENCQERQGGCTDGLAVAPGSRSSGCHPRRVHAPAAHTCPPSERLQPPRPCSPWQPPAHLDALLLALPGVCDGAQGGVAGAVTCAQAAEYGSKGRAPAMYGSHTQRDVAAAAAHARQPLAGSGSTLLAHCASGAVLGCIM